MRERAWLVRLRLIRDFVDLGIQLVQVGLDALEQVQPFGAGPLFHGLDHVRGDAARQRDMIARA